MSTYVHRIIEVNVYEDIEGDVSINNLDELNHLPEYENNMIYHISDIPWSDKETPHFKRWVETTDSSGVVTGHWEDVKVRNKHWVMLPIWYSNMSDEYYREKFNDVITHKDGTKTNVRKYTGYLDNGGQIRDYYFSTWGPYENIQNKGMASDASPELKKYLEEYEYKYNLTYVTLEDLCNISKIETESFKSKLKEVFTNKKLDELKDIVSAIYDKVYDIKKPKKTKKKSNSDEDYDEDYEYDPFEMLLEEDGDNVMSIKYEINWIYHMVDVAYGYMNDNDIRIHYFFC